MNSDASSSAASAPDTTGRAHRPVALVTGGSRGIGAAVVRDLGRDHHVIAGATTLEAAQAAIVGLESAEAFACDLSDADATHRALDGLGLDRLDVLVNNAGVSFEAHVGETERETWRRVFEINVFSVADVTRLLLPALRAAHGTIVMMNSGAAWLTGPNLAIYSGSKHALSALTKSLREEERGVVRVCSVHPGKVDTDMQVAIQSWRGNEQYDGSIYLRPESVAAAVRTCIAATDEAMVEELSLRPVVR